MISRISLIVIICITISFPALAGPPFRTDDPEPVEYRHWEMEIASQGSVDQDVTAFMAPHIEFNYGFAPNVRLHLIAPLKYIKGFEDIVFLSGKMVYIKLRPETLKT